MKSFPWQILIDWYSENGRHDYPWRQYDAHDASSYRVWLAEILLQQTQADRVVPFYTRILGRYPTIQDLANSTYDEFFPYYQGLGYYSRARNLLKTANIVSTEYQGIFPRDKQKLKKLPGVGEYTARAILAFGYGEVLLAWDTNLETIFSRYYKGAKNIKLTEDEKNEIGKDFQDFVSRKFGEQQMGVRGEDTVQNFRQKISSGDEGSISKSRANTRASLSTPDAFDTFGNKSIENSVWESMITRHANNALMDWARTMEPKTAHLLDPEKYIFMESEFYITNGTNEIIEKKISVSFPIPDAQVIVILHQDHRIYYSTKEKDESIKEVSTLNLPLGTLYPYSPFILPPSEDRDTRKYVQDYFRKNHQLELSVRTIHKKWITKDGQPYIAVNAQIQAGDPSIFEQYSKIEMKTSIEILYSLEYSGSPQPLYT